LLQGNLQAEQGCIGRPVSNPLTGHLRTREGSSLRINKQIPPPGGLIQSFSRAERFRSLFFASHFVIESMGFARIPSSSSKAIPFVFPHFHPHPPVSAAKSTPSAISFC
jgi:hypothetical protein